MHKFISVIKAFADEKRVRILMALRGRELCVCKIIELLDLAPSTVSKHLSIMYQAGMLESRKEGRWVHYRLASKNVSVEVQEAIAWVFKSLENEEKIQEDTRRLNEMIELEEILKCTE